MISTSPIKISCVIPADRVPDAVKALHQAFELGRRRDPARGPDRARAPAHGRRLSRRHTRTMAGDGYRVGVLGATGLVGTTILELLAERGFPAAEVVPFASERSAGQGAGVERLDARPAGS